MEKNNAIKLLNQQEGNFYLENETTNSKAILNSTTLIITLNVNYLNTTQTVSPA